MRPSNVIVVDNGAHTIKSGVADIDGEQPTLVPNAVVRSKGDKATYFGHEMEKCRDFSSLHFRLPFEKGYLVDWDAQKAVWDGLFSGEVLPINPTESTLLITEPYFDLPNIQDVYDQFVFEEYEFKSYYRCTPSSLIPYGKLYAQPGAVSPECMLVVDSGFSFTHVVPILNGSILWDAVKRIDVGGKLLTNHLKELVSYRQWNMMDETYIINDVKESCCYVSTDFTRDMETCRTDPKNNPIVREYILPDYSVNRRGRIRNPGESLDESFQILYMNYERFTVPEIIFRPDDIGLEQSGLADTIAASISLLPEDLQGMFWAHIGLIGGNTMFQGLSQRLTSELRSLAPVDCEVRLYLADNAITETYRSALSFVRDRPEELSQLLVTRTEYQEMGSNACRRKWRDWKSATAQDQTRQAGKGTVRTRAEEDEFDASPPAKRSGRSKGKGRTASIKR